MHEFIQKNFWLKVFSLVLAALIWFVLQSNFQPDVKYPQNPFRPQQTRQFQCPVTLLIPSSDRKLYTIDPTEVTVRVQGDANFMSELQLNNIQAYVNVANLKHSEGDLKIEVIAPREVSLNSIFPSHVHVKPST